MNIVTVSDLMVGDEKSTNTDLMSAVHCTSDSTGQTAVGSLE